MDDANLHRRVSELERELEALKASVMGAAERSRLAAPPVRNFAQLLMASWLSVLLLLALLTGVFVFLFHFFQGERNYPAAKQGADFVHLLVTNWVQVAFLWAVLIVAYVKIRFGIDYFENYRNASTTKELSNFYARLGDRLMGINEWVAAEEAYKAALKISPNNTAATYGVAKAQVFNPVHGEKVSSQEVIDVRLEYLLSSSPPDYQIHFLKGLRYQEMRNYSDAGKWFGQSIQMNPTFIGGHIGLGNLKMAQANPTGALDHYARAVELHPGSAVAKNGLGACLMLLSKYPEATRQFSESYEISPTALIASALGEAYWFSLNFRSALEFHQFAADQLNADPKMQDRYTRGGWRASFCPLQEGDFETIKKSVELYSVDEKKAVLHFQLAMDHALLENFTAANAEFEVALKLKPSPEILKFMQNRTQALQNRVKMSDASKSWLAAHGKMLE